MGKSKPKVSDWKQYNQALKQCGSLTVWMDDQAIKQRHCQPYTMAADDEASSTTIAPLRRR